MMKKLFCLILVTLTVLCCLTGCHFTQNISGSAAEEAEITPKVREMMTLLSQSRLDDVKAMMHPQAGQNLDKPLVQMISYLGGRNAAELEATSINTKTSSSPTSQSKQVQVSYRVELTDHNVIYISTTYLSNNAGTGFVTFQLVLGVV